MKVAIIAKARSVYLTTHTVYHTRGTCTTITYDCLAHSVSKDFDTQNIFYETTGNKRVCGHQSQSIICP